MKNSVVNIDSEGCVTAVKEKDNTFYLHYTVDDYTHDKLEISSELFDMIAKEFGEIE